MSDSATPQTQGWYAPDSAYQRRPKWYKPPAALSEEQLAALLEDRDAIAPALQATVLEDVSARPTRPGGWYAPQGGLGIEPARQLGELVGAGSSEAPPPEADTAADTPDDDEFLDNAPVVDVDAEEAAFRQSPRLLGESTQELRDAPDLPLSAQLNPGLGGLRDEERPDVDWQAGDPAAPATPQGAENALTPQQIAQMRDDAANTIQLPAQAAADAPQSELQLPERGLGGVRDIDSPAKSDTGPMPAVSASEQPQQGQAAGPQPAGSAQQQPSSASAQQQSASGQPMPSKSSVVQRFREVENSVQALKQQYAQGQITRNQLETELRRLMVLDEEGRWWTLGVDSKRWYRYDGREWVPDTPPQTAGSPPASEQQPGANRSMPQQQQPSQGQRQGGTDAAALNVPTETGAQPAAGSAAHPQRPQTAGTGASSQTGGVAIDDYGMPLPQRVTVDDPGATAVNLNAVTAGGDEVTIEKPGPRGDAGSQESGAGQQAGSEQVSAVSPGQNEGDASGANMTQEGALANAYQIGPDGQASPDNYYSQEDAPQAKPKRDSFQPDYSEALGTSFSRSSVLRVGVWTGVAGLAASLAVVFCVLMAMVAYYFNTVGAYDQEIETLPQRASTFQTAIIYGQDESLELASFNDPNRGARTRVELEDISPWAIHALVSTEDETFYENPGFSVFAIVRAAYTNVTSTGPTSGASTITQQLARRLLLDEEFATELSAQRKVTEIILAAEISRQYTKNEILELYFNEMSFGGFTVGIEAAAQVYFEKSAAELNVFESALLVGLVQSPSLYDPFRNREAALGRMDTVLRLMTESNDTGCVEMEHTTNVSGFDLSTPLCVSNEYLVNEVPDLKAFVEGRRFEFFGAERRYDHFTLWVWDQVNRLYPEEEIFNNGFRIFTTIDSDIQEIAQSQIQQQVSNPNWQANNGSAVVINPQNGAVLAMVGSADFDNQNIDGEVNVAFTPQQPGSAIKPVVYLGALEGFPEQNDYWTAATPIWDVPTQYGSGPGAYNPTNFDLTFRGPVSLRFALANSLNVTAVKALAYTGTADFEELSNRMGITFPLQSPQQAGLPSALGAAEVELFDMVASYAAFANGGFRYEPFGISRIEDIDGNVIYDAFVSEQLAATQTVNPQHAYIISDILSDQATRSTAFGNALVVPGFPNVAMKTGTSNDARDLLTIGWTPTVVAGVWIGNTDNTPTFATAGSQVAAPVVISIMQQALPSRQDAALDFTPPGGLGQATICNVSGTRVPATGCAVGGTREEIFVAPGALETWPEGQLPPSGEEGFVQTVQVDAFTNQLVNQFCPNFPVQRTFLNVDDPTAISWIRDTAQGRSWAERNGIDPDNINGELPSQECSEGYTSPTATLTGPANGQVLENRVTIYGSAASENFDRFEIQFAPLSNPENWQALPGQVFEFTYPQPNSVLGLWNTTSAQDGQYRLRVAVFAENTFSITSDPITVTIRNNQAQPTSPPPDNTTAPGATDSSNIPSLDDIAAPTGEAIPAGEQ
jgi:membrane peptidoglycan carboxypeptidase